MDFDEFDWDEPSEWPWDSIDHVHITRDDLGWDVSVEINGELFDILDGLDDDYAASIIWDEIWHLADEYGVDVDKDVEYAAD